MKIKPIAAALSACLALAGMASVASAADIGELVRKADGGDYAAMVEAGRYYLNNNEPGRGMLYLQTVTREGGDQAAYAHAALANYYGNLADNSAVARDAMMFNYRRAAVLGDVNSQVRLGALLLTDATKAKDAAKRTQDQAQAQMVLEHASNVGQSAEAAYQLGRAFTQGVGLPRDEARGEQWLNKAAERQHNLAAYALGLQALSKKDPTRAERYLEQAANRGYGAAMLDLAKAYESGSLPQNFEAAQRWADRAVDANVPGAAAVQSSVKDKLQRRYAVEPARAPAPQAGNPIAASSPYARVMPASAPTNSPVRPLSEVDQLRQQVELLTRQLNEISAGGGTVAAAASIDSDVVDIAAIRAVEHRSLNQLGMDAHARGDFKEAYRYFTRAARKDDADAMNNLGMLLLQGQGVEADVDKAIVMFRRAAELGHSTAAHNIGYIYENAMGVREDRARARVWFQFSARLAQQNRNMTNYAGL
ncbi:hypothetical protein VPH13_13535 [Stenotrophomonas pavanii]|uniref:tetratricopeptide repeat protein n=1 Tax=Stenotrophomonas pavanii TaxID=487698 RepID=UPI002DBBFA50|nr:hypothetical protein [Stenotrophomonas pavanii]MEC4339741.1 hypothetical protein [Stenotrophomonas pavanii]